MSHQELNQDSDIDWVEVDVSNIHLPPPPGLYSDDDDNDDDDLDDNYSDNYFETDSYIYGNDGSDYSSDFSNDAAFAYCTKCQKSSLTALECVACCAAYCREHASQYFWLDEDGQYKCNTCLNRMADDSEEWRGNGVLTLEMLCAFNMALNLWKNYESFESLCGAVEWDAHSQSIMESVDQAYPSLPITLKNLIARAVFLLGIELYFYSVHWEDISVLSEVSHNVENEKSDHESEWKSIKWSPHFTIEDDYLDES